MAEVETRDGEKIHESVKNIPIYDLILPLGLHQEYILTPIFKIDNITCFITVGVDFYVDVI